MSTLKTYNPITNDSIKPPLIIIKPCNKQISLQSANYIDTYAYTKKTNNGDYNLCNTLLLEY